MKALKTKLNPIPLSLRGKKRYIEFELLPDNDSKKTDFNEKDVSKAVWNIMLSLYGGFGVAKQKIWLIRYDSISKKGILRCSLNSVEEVKAGLLFLKEINGLKVIPNILGVKGSIKGIKE